MLLRLSFLTEVVSQFVAVSFNSIAVYYIRTGHQLVLRVPILFNIHFHPHIRNFQ